MQSQLENFRLLLCQLGAAIRDILYAQQSKPSSELAAVAAHTTADTIYQIDKVSEELIIEWLGKNWPEDQPIRLIMEGIEDDEAVIFPSEAAAAQIAYHLIIDPIDGTRGIMYDKRPAWALIGLAATPSIGALPTLEEITVAVMTELPTSKQHISEQLSATLDKSGATTLFRVSTDLISGEEKSIPHAPSKATDLNHGFASVAKFFPQAKAALAAFEEELFAELTPDSERDDALIFDDQYISTGGQLYELIAGHDRLVVDIRPIAFQKLGFPLALTCHPYDLCTALVARAAGVIVRLVDSPKLEVPFDTTSTVSWIAYANADLARSIQPVVEKLVAKHFH